MPPARESLAVSGSSGQIPSGATVGGRFRIEGLLFQDAASQTYRAADLSHRNAAAVRVIPLRVLGASAAQLETDVENASALVHKNLLEVLTVGREADFFYIATELLDGQTLREFIDGKKREGRTVSFRGACNLVTHVANGLERAASSMPHGGLNPVTIWVNKAGRVKVADLGLARTLPMLARRGGPVGAPEQAYVAPELLAGAPPTLASDSYSLGVILFEVLTGRLPSPNARSASQGTDAPPAVDAVIAKALARDPNARYRSPMELRQALAQLQSGTVSGVSSAAPSPATASPAPVAVAAAAQPQSGERPAMAFAAQPQAPQAAAAASAEGRRSTGGRSFNLAEVAGGAIDDAQERWLIQKDRLDFGPFSLAQIRAQIGRGEILGEHMIVDSDTGARKKVKDFPALRDFARNSERQLEQTRRAHAEIKHEKSEKTKSFFTFMVVTIALLGIGGAGAWYVLTRKAADKTQLAERSEEAEIDAFLKDVKLSFQRGTVAKRGSGGAHRSGGGSTAGDGDFSNDANFGDASKHGSGGDETLDDGVIEETMMRHYRGLVPCLMQERKRNAGVSEMSLDFVVRGTGKVSAVKVNGQKGGSFASCVLGRMPTFPKFNGNKTIASWSMSMR
jgi:eukaryotic-like serine/threonine-protein kinase